MESDALLPGSPNPQIISEVDLQTYSDQLKLCLIWNLDEDHPQLPLLFLQMFLVRPQPSLDFILIHFNIIRLRGRMLFQLSNKMSMDFKT